MQRQLTPRQLMARAALIMAALVFLYTANQSLNPTDNSKLGRIRRQVEQVKGQNTASQTTGEGRVAQLSGKALAVSIFEKISDSVPPYGVIARDPLKFEAKNKHDGTVIVRCDRAVKSPPQCSRCKTQMVGALPPKVSKNYMGLSFYAATNMDPGKEHISLVDAILNRYKPSDGVVLDVGANEGLVGLYAAAKGFKTIAFEALPSNYHHVRSSAIFNNWKEDRYDVVLGGASNVCGQVIRIAENQGDSSDPLAQSNGQILGLSHQEGDPGRKDVLTISTVRIDDVVHEDVIFMKMDVEGYEPRAMSGAMKLLVEKRVDWIHLEFSPSNMKETSGDDGSRLLTALSALGFEIYIEDCVHNIIEPVKSEVGCGHPESVDLLNAIVNADHDPAQRKLAEAKQVKPDKIKWFVKKLFDGMVPIHCCVVNMLLYRRPKA